MHPIFFTSSISSIVVTLIFLLLPITIFGVILVYFSIAIVGQQSALNGLNNTINEYNTKIEDKKGELAALEEKKKAGYIKIKDADLYSEGTSLNELVKYDDKLYIEWKKILCPWFFQ